MIKYPLALEKLVKSFSNLPGVGEKTALRQAMHVVKWPYQDIKDFSDALSMLGDISYCKECGVFSDDEICSICSDSKRDNEASLCVVESITDLMAIENSNQYKGLYHILGGVLNPLLGVGPDQLRINKLHARVIEKNIKTIILAINPSVEGDATCAYIRQIISDDVDIQRIGFGMPMGGSLEFLDPLTISKALENRKSL